MSANTTYRRRARTQQNETQGDVIVIALTAQVIVCILLLMIAAIAKNADESRYDKVRAQYHLMVTDPQSSAEAFDEFAEAGGGLGRLFASLEQMITSLVQRFTGGAELPPAEEAEPPAEESFADEEPVGERFSADESAPAADGFAYDYLGSADVLGQGGAFPVSTGGADTSLLGAPEGSTFSPVALAGRAVPPVTGLITSGFSYREHPVNGDDDFHTGVDIAAEEGRDILAALPGEVVEVGESEIYGNYIILQHATNLRTFYAHCSEIIARPPMAVRQGERIAKVGQTGLTTGPHLHFSVIVEGQFTDPYWILEDNIQLVE